MGTERNNELVQIQARVLSGCILSLSAIESDFELPGTRLDFSKKDQINRTEYLQGLGLFKSLKKRITERLTSCSFS